MCGVIGFIGRDRILDDKRWMLAQKLQQHRGPDDSGATCHTLDNWKIQLSHQRLAIIDLSAAGHQPMMYGNGRGVIVYNGELYNYCELRDELIARGQTFHTQTDTEVVLAALHFWGAREAIKKFNGMWAFAWLDFDGKCLWLSRDRGSEKPLYWHQNGDNFYFASEIKSLLTIVPQKFALNLEVVGEYFIQSLLDSSTKTFFEGIESVPAGSFIRIDLDTQKLAPEAEPYWNCSLDCDSVISEGDLPEHIRELFFDAVRIRLRSDVPVGVLLSGGIDSSAIAAAVNYINKKDGELNLLSAVSTDNRFDESPFIDRVAKYLDRPIDKVVLDLRSETAFRYLEEATWFNDTPIGYFSTVAHYMLMQKARERGLTVILSGQGADELLCGYKKYLGFYIQSLIRQGKVGNALKTLLKFWQNDTILSQFSLPEAKRYLPKWTHGVDIDTRGKRLRDFIPPDMGLRKGMSVQERQLEDLQRFSVPVLTHYEDRMSMACSREIRLPFLDVRLIELFLPLKMDYKLGGGWTKYIFRKAMEPYLPPEIVWRKDKQGFLNPQSEWLKNELREDVLKYFGEDSLIFDYGLVDSRALLKKYEAFCKQPANQGRIWFKDIFNPLALEIWLRKFNTHISKP